jgi:tetratricopeptide (TPR) repeat protein
MSYPGNPALSADTRQRLLGTFDQTLELAEGGSRQEALLGCDFVLRMDPQFEPARKLQERLRSSAGPVPVADLKGAGNGGGALDELHDLSHLAAELPELDDLDLADELPDLPPAEPAAGSGDLRAQYAQLLESRRFPQLLERVERESAAVLADPELGRMAETAHQRMEAEPYVHKFLDKVRQAIAKGDGAEADRLLEKARSLDPTHPEIAALAAERAAPPPLPPPLAFPSVAASMSTAPIAAASAGFSLEPDRPPDPSPATPELPSPLRPIAPSVPSGESETDRRIRQLLDEGQAAFDGGDPQAAIDSWSRIFLIDIDHQEAARRIEGARKLKAESERQVEEIFHDGLGRLEAGDLAAARQAFERVLELQPSYLAAREYLQQLDAGQVPVAPAIPAPRDPALATGEGPALPLPGLDAPTGELKEEILVPPEPGEGGPAGARRGRREREARAGEAPAEGEAPAAGKKRASRNFVYVGSAVLALVLAAGGYVYLNRDRYFPNSTDEAALLVPKVSPIARATALHKQGKNAVAVAQLRRIPAKDPHYQEAQKLIAAWEAPAAPALPAPLAPDVAERRNRLLAEARQASAEHSYLQALDRFEEAGKLAKLEGADAADLAAARHAVEPFATQVEAFRQHEWEYALPTLWKLHEKDPANKDVERLIVDCYYDLGVRDLQRSDPAQAAGRFSEALKLHPDDADLKRAYLFAQTYQERPQDMLFRIYVKYLPLR